jgi:hypothetical protein
MREGKRKGEVEQRKEERKEMLDRKKINEGKCKRE